MADARPAAAGARPVSLPGGTDTQPASLLGPADTQPASLLDPPESQPASMLGSGPGSMYEETLVLPLDESRAGTPTSSPPYGESPSTLESPFPAGAPSAPADPAMRSLIVSLRRSFGAGRLLQGSRWVRLSHASPPVRIQTNQADPMRTLYAKQELLLRKGRIHWAAVVPIERALQQPGQEDLPGLLVVGTDDHFDARPAELAAIAARLAALRTAPAATPELRRFAQQVRNDSGRPLGVELPPALAGRPVVLTSFMAVRSHLPDTALTAGWFPVLVHPSSVIPMIVPCAFWNAALRAAWDAHRLGAARAPENAPA